MSDTFRKVYKVLSDEQKAHIENIKDKAEELEKAFRESGLKDSIDNRRMALAYTNLEQSIMWAIKAIT